jgi:ATP-dependent exoDNAse (exonuclease V) alpha subunit
LNELIRAGLQHQGALSGPERHADVLVPRDLTKAQLRDAASLHIGDVVRFGKDYRGVDIRKGEYGLVEGTNPDHGTVLLRMEANGRAVDWQPDRHVVVEVFQKEQRDLQDGDFIRWTRNDYSQHRRNGDVGRVSIDLVSGSMVVRERNGKETVFNPETERHWDYGYASTVHASQGRTADRTIYHADSQQLATNKEGWYVAVSRARDDLRVVTDDVVALKEVIGESRIQASALEAVERHRSERSHAANPALREGVSERTGPSRQLEIER